MILGLALSTSFAPYPMFEITIRSNSGYNTPQIYVFEQQRDVFIDQILNNAKTLYFRSSLDFFPVHMSQIFHFLLHLS